LLGYELGLGLKAKIYGVGISIHGLRNYFTFPEMKSGDKQALVVSF